LSGHTGDTISVHTGGVLLCLLVLPMTGV